MQKHTSNLPITQEKTQWLKGKIRDIPDFPKPGIVFKDLTTLLKDREALKFVIDTLAEKYSNLTPKYIAGIEARGFILAPAVAYSLGIGFIPIRKPGKLPYQVERVPYELEYGTGNLEIHRDAANPGEAVIIIDDLLATGGTAVAAYSLLKTLQVSVSAIGFIVELGFLRGRQKLPSNVEVFSIVNYD